MVTRVDTSSTSESASPESWLDDSMLWEEVRAAGEAGLPATTEDAGKSLQNLLQIGVADGAQHELEKAKAEIAALKAGVMR